MLLLHPSVLAWMRRFYAHHGQHGAARVVGCSYGTFLRWLRRAAEGLGWGAIQWSSHSLRRGGASELAMTGLPIADLLEFGRWLSMRSAREYIRRGELGLHAARRDVSASARERVYALASIGPTIWDLV